MIEQTKERLSQMKLFGALSSLENRLTEGTQHGWGNADFFSAMIDDEYMYRQERKTRRLVIAAKFRTEASFEKLDTTAKRNLSRGQISDLKNLTFLRNPHNVLILGPTGVGKTFLATAMGYHACRSGYSVQFIGMNMFMEQMVMSRIAGTYFNFRKRLINVDLLIIDDLGIKPLSAESTQDFYDILEERFQQRPTIITSQLPINNWKEVITDEVAYEAIMDRLIHTDFKIELSGESYRRNLGGPK